MNKSEKIVKTFIQVIASPYFAIEDIAMVLNDHHIEYAVIGGIALAAHNYKRQTLDIDILISKKSFEVFTDKLVGVYFKGIAGSTRNFYYLTDVKKYRVEFLVEGDNNGIEMPNPLSIRTKMYGVWYIDLKNLIILKLNASRTKDISDVEYLIVNNELPLSFLENSNFCNEYTKIWNSLKRR